MDYIKPAIIVSLLFLSHSLISQSDTIVIDINDRYHTRVVSTNINGVKVDSVYKTIENSRRFNKELLIYKNGFLVEEFGYYNNQIHKHIFYNGDQYAKIIFYVRKRNNFLRQINYYDDNGELSKKEYYKRNGDLIVSERRIQRKEKKNRKAIERFFK